MSVFDLCQNSVQGVCGDGVNCKVDTYHGARAYLYVCSLKGFGLFPYLYTFIYPGSVYYLGCTLHNSSCG